MDGTTTAKMRRQVLYIVRHGVRLDFEDKTWAYTADNPDDSPLSATGIKQAGEVAVTLQKDIAALSSADETTQNSTDRSIQHYPHVKVCQVFSSPFTRCVHTASEVAKTFDKRVCLEEGISEWTECYTKKVDASMLRSSFPLVSNSRVY